MPARRLLPTVAVVGATALVGCGSSGGDRPTPADEAATARAALLRLPDLPGGWRALPDADDDATSSCPAVRAARAESTGRADADTYAAPAGAPQVSDVVSLFADARAARAAFAGLTSAATRTCLAREVTTVRGDDDGRFSAPRISGLLVGARADQVSGTRFATTLRTDGDPAVRVVVDVVTLRRGRATSRVTLTAQEVPASYALRSSALQAAVRRLDAALATTRSG